jgi:hypothetical protein
MMKWQNKDEYHGEWKRGLRNGEGLFKKGNTGKIKRAFWKNDKRIKVLEEIKK